MARIPKEPRVLKDGTEVYDIVVFIKDSDKKLYSRTYTRENGIGENEHKRRINAFAVNFENEIRNQVVANKQTILQRNDAITFSESSAKWLRRSEQKDSKTFIVRNTKVVQDLNNFLGKMTMKLIKPYDTTCILDYLNEKKIVKEIDNLKKPIEEIIEKNNVNKLCRENDFSTASVFYAKKGRRLKWDYEKNFVRH